jgi:hypothetical protein
MAEEQDNRLNKAATAVAEKFDADVIGYFGDIMSPNDWRITYHSGRRRLRTNVILMLQTSGGDPHAAYRIARSLQRAYQTLPQTFGQKRQKKGSFYVFVNSRCKSAGTLLALGADGIFMSETAELGPIDVQLRKPEEVGERTSGLTPIQALLFLEERSTTLFKRHFKSLRFSEDLVFSTKMAADTATNITTGLLGPIYQQIDPIRLAEVDRSLKISTEYGERIGKSNLKSGALEKLLAGYPSHSFVIDLEEARELFVKVDEPTPELRELADAYDSIADYYEAHESPYCFWLAKEPPEPPKAATIEPVQPTPITPAAVTPNGKKPASRTRFKQRPSRAHRGNASGPSPNN